MLTSLSDIMRTSEQLPESKQLEKMASDWLVRSGKRNSLCCGINAPSRGFMVVAQKIAEAEVCQLLCLPSHLTALRVSQSIGLLSV